MDLYVGEVGIELLCLGALLTAWMGSICTLPGINSACRSVLEKQVILNESLIEKDCMSRDERTGRKSRR